MSAQPQSRLTNMHALILITDDHRLSIRADYGSSDLTVSNLAFSGHSLDPPHSANPH